MHCVQADIKSAMLTLKEYAAHIKQGISLVALEFILGSLSQPAQNLDFGSKFWSNDQGQLKYWKYKTLLEILSISNLLANAISISLHNFPPSHSQKLWTMLHVNYLEVD